MYILYFASPNFASSAFSFINCLSIHCSMYICIFVNYIFNVSFFACLCFLLYRLYASFCFQTFAFITCFLSVYLLCSFKFCNFRALHTHKFDLFIYFNSIFCFYQNPACVGHKRPSRRSRKHTERALYLLM